MTNGALNGILNNYSILEDSVPKFSEVKDTSEEKDFASILKNAITDSLQDTQQLIDFAEKGELEMAIGKADNTYDLMIAQNKASMAVAYTVAVRDRLLESYRTIMNMQV